MKKIIYQGVGVFLFVISLMQVNAASGIWGYQPKLPEKLVK